jgi:hypothetical protein
MFGQHELAQCEGTVRYGARLQTWCGHKVSFGTMFGS